MDNWIIQSRQALGRVDKRKKKSIEACGIHAPYNAHRDSEQKKVPVGVEMKAKALDRWIDLTPLSPY
jgi:hypothetical protein